MKTAQLVALLMADISVCLVGDAGNPSVDIPPGPNKASTLAGKSTCCAHANGAANGTVNGTVNGAVNGANGHA
jgi:hypothetical protein